MRKRKVKFSYLYLAVILMLLSGLLGCGKGINKNDNDIFCPVDYTFQASYDQSWNATRKAVMELSNVEVMNVNMGIITSDITTVKGEEMVFLDHAPNKTYKYTYDIKLRREEKDATKISTQVKLLPEQFLLQSNKKNKKTQTESYLREKLYKKVCSNLFPNGKGHCSNGFIEQTIQDQQPTIVTTPSPPPPKGFDPKIKSAQQALNSAGYKAVVYFDTSTFFSQASGVVVTATAATSSFILKERLSKSGNNPGNCLRFGVWRSYR